MKKKKMITIRVSDDELVQFKALAKSHDLSLGELIRKLLLGEKPKRKRSTPTADPKLIFQIAAIGNNLNQIARKVNQGDRFDLMPHLVAIENQLEQLLNAHQVH
jgi:hypothetical protein